MNFYRPWIMLFTLWFALLQSVAPLMHAHAQGDSDMDDGPHMHLIDVPELQETAPEPKQSFHWHIHADHTHGQIIGIAPAIEEKDHPSVADATVLPLLTMVIALICSIGLFIPLISRRIKQYRPILRHFLTLHSPLTSRAPPAA